MEERIIVGIAEGKTAVAGQVLVSYALGSCVGVCIYDSKKRMAGMAHVVLPERPHNIRRSNAYKFANEGVSALIGHMCAMGCERQQLCAKIAGGARMFDTGSDQWNIGIHNATAIKSALAREGVPVVGEDTGRNYGRTLLFHADDGTLEIQTVRRTSVIL